MNAIKKYKITGNSYQSLNVMFNEKMFHTPKKGENVTIECLELPKNIIRLQENNLITIKEIV